MKIVVRNFLGTIVVGGSCKGEIAIGENFSEANYPGSNYVAKNCPGLAIIFGGIVLEPQFQESL